MIYYTDDDLINFWLAKARELYKSNSLFRLLQESIIKNDQNWSLLIIPGRGVISSVLLGTPTIDPGIYRPNFYITLNFFTRVQSQVTAAAGVTTGCLISGEVRQLQENRQSVKKKMIQRSKDSNNAELGMGLFSSVQEHPHHHHQPTSPVVASNTDRAVNKRSINRKAIRKVIKTTVSNKQIDTGQEQEFHQRWGNENDVIVRIVDLGKRLGHTPTYLDLYCAGFESAEIAAISDLLEPLLASDEDAEVIPWASVEVPSEVMMA